MERKKQHLRIERKHSRLKTEIPCVLGCPGGDLSAGLIRDMSQGGLKLSCGQDTIYNILPENNRTPGMISDVMVEIQYEILRPDQTTLAVKCNANLIHFERLAQNNFHLGIEFVRMDKSTKKGLRSYLQSALETQQA